MAIRRRGTYVWTRVLEDFEEGVAVEQMEYELAPEAEYTLETSVCCPGCKESVDTVYVVRLLRTRVNFTSSLPRRGYVVVCPSCRTVVPAAVG